MAFPHQDLFRIQEFLQFLLHKGGGILDPHEFFVDDLDGDKALSLLINSLEYFSI